VYHRCDKEESSEDEKSTELYEPDDAHDEDLDPASVSGPSQPDAAERERERRCWGFPSLSTCPCEKHRPAMLKWMEENVDQDDAWRIYVSKCPKWAGEGEDDPRVDDESSRSPRRYPAQKVKRIPPIRLDQMRINAGGNIVYDPNAGLVAVDSDASTEGYDSDGSVSTVGVSEEAWVLRKDIICLKARMTEVENTLAANNKRIAALEEKVTGHTRDIRVCCDNDKDNFIRLVKVEKAVESLEKCTEHQQHTIQHCCDEDDLIFRRLVRLEERATSSRASARTSEGTSAAGHSPSSTP